MAGIQVGGVGSGLDVASLVSQLVSAERAPLEQRIVRHETKVTTSLSALGTLKGALSSFQTALEPLKTTDVFQKRTATTSSNDYFAASASTTAATGSYDVEVLQVAKAQQLASTPFNLGAAAQVGYGSLSISVGAESFSVSIAQDKNTLGDIRDAINASSDNKGVQATLLNTAGGARLVLTSSKTGADHAIQVQASGGDGGLNQFVYQSGGTMNLTELAPAQDARIRLANSDDFIVESHTNVFDNVIDGVSITVKKPTKEDEPVALDVAFDKTTVTSNIQKFVTEYNKMQAAVAKLRSYNPETKAAGPLLGDAMLRGIEEQLRRSLSDPVSGVADAYSSLARVGIKTTTTGALELDTAKLDKALDSDPAAVAKLFGSEDGVAARMSAQIEARLADSGDMEARTKQLNSEIKKLQEDRTALDARMTQIQARYQKQFTALDSLLTQMQSQSSYLTQQLSKL